MKIRNLFILIAAVLISISCKSDASKSEVQEGATTANLVTPSQNSVKNISAAEVKTLMLDNLEIEILDVRTPGEYGAGHLKKSENVDFLGSEFLKNIENLDPNKTYLVYCAVGGRSNKAAQLMQKQGFNSVYNSKEGFSALKKVGIEVD
jgi:rhodanese-related sulfurtransferase